jgi:hypothetical protein
MGAHDAAADMWVRTEVKPAELDLLALYDGFSIFVPLWLEAMGLCGHGEAKDFIAVGNIAPGGRYPVNTGGGQLSAGRLHGFKLIHEACLWGDGGERQVEARGSPPAGPAAASTPVQCCSSAREVGGNVAPGPT